MKMPALDSIPSTTNARTQRAQVRIVLVVLCVFVLGAAAAVFTYLASRGRASKADDGNKRPVLSESTKSVLRRLDSRVEIRFYSLLDPASVPESLNAFARRVDQLLSEFEREANGKLRLTRLISPSDAGSDAAAADGIRAFNLEKGDACFLGIAIVHDKQKETIPTISPEWEQALEFDVIRAIARVIAPKPKTNPLATSSQPDKSAIANVKRTLPNLDSLPLEDGKRILQEQALTDFKKAALEMETQVKQAQQRLAQALQAGSKTEQQAARSALLELQSQQAEKLKDIAIQLQTQLGTLEQLKNENRPAEQVKPQ